MKRHFYISNDLDDLEKLELELEESGITKPQIHVLSQNDTDVDKHRHLHNIEAVFKQDVVHGTIVGAAIGIGLATLVLALVSFSGIAEAVGWMPFLFLAVVVMGFGTWLGGFYGIQTPHKDFRQFQNILNAGKHVFIVDVDPEQESILEKITAFHSTLEKAGTGSATPRWVVKGQQTFKDVTTTTFP